MTRQNAEHGGETVRCRCGMTAEEHIAIQSRCQLTPAEVDPAVRHNHDAIGLYYGCPGCGTNGLRVTPSAPTHADEEPECTCGQSGIHFIDNPRCAANRAATHADEGGA